MSQQFGPLLYMISVWALPAIIAITFHQAAHGFVARFFGDNESGANTALMANLVHRRVAAIVTASTNAARAASRATPARCSRPTAAS